VFIVENVKSGCFVELQIIELVEAARLEQRDGDSLCLDHFQKVFPKIQARTTPERIAVFDEFHMLYSH